MEKNYIYIYGEREIGIFLYIKYYNRKLISKRKLNK